MLQRLTDLLLDAFYRWPIGFAFCAMVALNILFAVASTP